MLAVLGRSWGLCWRSWAALGAYVDGLGPLSGPKLAVLGEKWLKPERGRDLASGSGPRSGPNPSGKAVLGRGWKSIVFGARHLLSIFSDMASFLLGGFDLKIDLSCWTLASMETA